jgi:hypothetical protein
MFKKISIFILSLSLLFVLDSCKKISSELNINPNVPDKVTPNLILASALTSSADIIAGNPGGGAFTGNQIFNAWMGYYAVSGGFIPNGQFLTYNITSDIGQSNWAPAYITMENYQKVIDYYGADANTKGSKYTVIARIMKAIHFARLVDLYNNVPYSEALKGGVINYPKYDKGQAIYDALVVDLEDCVAIINSGVTATAEDPLTSDVVYGGNMTKWKSLANTIKLKLLVHQSHLPAKAAYITSKMAGLTTASFLGINADATIQPGFANDQDNHQNYLWNDIGFTLTGNLQGNRDYYRANSYAVKFYSDNNDPRLGMFYTPLANGTYAGRAYGSTNSVNETNDLVSALGGNKTGAAQSFGTLKSASQASVLFPSTESLFLQAEAIERGFLAGDANTTYRDAVRESFRILGVTNANSAADTYIAQSSASVNLLNSSNRINTIITQKWAALNTYDPVESWTDWRRLTIPANLPVSIYPGTNAPHIPYRLPYPTSENTFNPASIAAEGAINPITSKIFWMP